jgi:hypothetical protein
MKRKKEEEHGEPWKRWKDKEKHGEMETTEESSKQFHTHPRIPKREKGSWKHNYKVIQAALAEDWQFMYRINPQIFQALIPVQRLRDSDSSGVEGWLRSRKILSSKSKARCHFENGTVVWDWVTLGLKNKERSQLREIEHTAKVYGWQIAMRDGCGEGCTWFCWEV